MLLFRKLHTSLSPLRLRLSGSATFIPYIHRLSSSIAAAEDEGPPPTSQFAVNYLIQSCGLPSDKATQMSRYLPRLKSPENPDAVLQFLRQAGISQSHIRAAALRDPSFLCFSVDNCLKPRFDELLQMRFSPSHISILFSINPRIFKHTELQHKIQFWFQILGSVEKLLLLIKRNMVLLKANPEITAMRNISFLQGQCGLSVRQIARLMMSAPRLILARPETLEIKVKRAEVLGISRSSGMFMAALHVVSCLSQSTVNARLLYLKSLGLSQDEVNLMICKFPTVLTLTEKIIGPKMEFLLKEAACDKLHIVQFPSLLAHSLEKRLIPRNIVRNLLHSKGLPLKNKPFYSFVVLTEESFLKRFVLPYESDLPGLHQAYTEACAGKTKAIEV